MAGAHGVRGGVRIKSFTAVPEDVAAYGPLTDESGARTFRLTLVGHGKGVLLARIEGIADRDAAEALRGTRLYVERDTLPPPEEEEYYHADLIGLRAEDEDGRELGKVTAVHDFGAGDLLEIARPGASAMVVPFTRAAVPVVDLAGGRVVVVPPETLDEDRSGDDGTGEAS